MAGIARIPREICGNKDGCCRNTAGMEMGDAGIPWDGLFVFAKILQTITILCGC